MKILMVNKFLYLNGGSETYVLKIGEYLTSIGHEVQYFGMKDDRNIVGNNVESYTSNFDFHTGKLKKIIYPFKIIYSAEARKKIRKILKDFKPDIVHLNNFNFQITPSIIYEIKKDKIPVIMTVHDPQMVCPNHRLYIESAKKICELCIKGHYYECIKNKCFHNSKVESIVGAIESYVYHSLKTYDKIDIFLSPSRFMKEILIKGGVDVNKISILPNFSAFSKGDNMIKKENYVLYFGRISYEKGIRTLLNACLNLKNIKFLFVGSGPMEEELKAIENVKYIGFKGGKELHILISQALFTIYPSEWYENCPLAVIESQVLGTPVIGANIGGIPELIEDRKTGLLFESGNVQDLKLKILELYNSPEKLEQMSEECLKKKKNTVDTYCSKLIELYEKQIQKASIVHS